MNLGYYIIVSIFLGALVFYNWFKQANFKKVISRFNKDDILLHTYGVEFYGIESEKEKLFNSQGLMILLKNGLYYKGRFDKRELFISKGKIYSIVVTDHHKGYLTHKKCLAFYFENSSGNIDRAAFLIPNPKRWVEMIKEVLSEDRRIIIKEELVDQ